MANGPYKHAVDMCRDAWLRYRTLPWWRLIARRKALAEAKRWGDLAIDLTPPKK